MTFARNEIRWIWNELCSGLDLTRRVVPTGTVTREPPRIGRVVLGPPTSFTVELRPGQLRQDVAMLQTRLAAAYDVPRVDVRDLVRGWIVVEMVENLQVPTSGAARIGHRAPTTHLPPRPSRGPSGRPRSWGLRRPRRHRT